MVLEGSLLDGLRSLLAHLPQVATQHQALGPIPIVNRPIKFPGAPQPIPTAPPVLREHTDALLVDVLDMMLEPIAALRAPGAIA
jgi:crotonobetainyl-CoA:carnitine CoA-transferase CaiB-like acyl-CoA transferase